MSNIIHIDGSQGEGGGQILRSAMALAAITGIPVSFERIRAKRAKPGLMRQHLTAVRAVAEVSGGHLVGDELGSDALRFEPGPVRAGEYHFRIASAGSACLVFQAVLWPLCLADGASRVVFEGGTHNPKAPPFDFLAHSFLPAVRRMGVRVDARLERHGFYPAGGGRFVVDIEPMGAGARLQPVELVDAGPATLVRVRALVANLPGSIAQRELNAVRRGFGHPPAEARAEAAPEASSEAAPEASSEAAAEAAPEASAEAPAEASSEAPVAPAAEYTIEPIEDAPGTGNVLFLELACGGVHTLVTGFGERGKSAEKVAAEAVHAARVYLHAGMPVGVHLADQLVLPLALAGGGSFRTLPLSLHCRTNIEVVQRFLPVAIEVVEADDCALVRVSS